MNAKIETKEELKYIMRFLEIKEIELPKNLGRVELNGDALTYVTDGYYQSYKHQYRHLAFEDAIKCINEDMEKLEVWRETAKKTFKTRILDEDRHNLLCEFTDVDRSQVYLGYRAFTDDHPEVFWISIGFGLRNHTGIYSIYPKDELKEKKKEF